MGLLTIARRALAGFKTKAAPRTLSGVDGGRGWVSLWSSTFDGTGGAWQRDEKPADPNVILAQSTVFACVTLIAADIGKLCLKLVERSPQGIWAETESGAFSPVLRKPNAFQTMQLFIEQWIFSLLTYGNAYVLKVRDNRGVVVAMYVLDPTRVQPLVANDGSVYYQLQQDDLSRLPEGNPAVPASEIIHDRINCLFHPLVGVSPLFACALASTQALKILRNSAKFFENMSRPSGILTAPAQISDETATRLKDAWEKNYTGEKIGKVAVLGDGLKYESMSVNPEDAQLVEQLKLSAEQICAVFHVPAYMVGAGAIPANTNVQSLTLGYFEQCLQKFIKRIEDALDEGLGLPYVQGKTLGTMFDLDDLLRMDTMTLTAALKDQVGAGITKPNEARQRLNLPPVEGGDTPYLQQQNFALSALAKRDAGEDPFGTAKPEPAAPPIAEPVPPADDAAKGISDSIERVGEALLKAIEPVRAVEPDKTLMAEAAAEAVSTGTAHVVEAIKAMTSELRAEQQAQAARVEAAEKAAQDADLATEQFFAALERRLQLEPACG